MKNSIFLIFFISIAFPISIFIVYQGEAEPFSISVCDHEMPNNRNHPLNITITIPNKVISSCRMEIDAFLDPDDIYLRAVHFKLDNIGGPIGVERIGWGETRGAIFSAGETVHHEYDMSNCQFAKEWPETGSFYQSFIPTNMDYKNGTLSPGEHEIWAAVSSYDDNSGALVESWISIRLYFNDSFNTFIIMISIVMGVAVLSTIIVLSKIRSKKKRLPSAHAESWKNLPSTIRERSNMDLRRDENRMVPKEVITKKSRSSCLVCGNSKHTDANYCPVCGTKFEE